MNNSTTTTIDDPGFFSKLRNGINPDSLVEPCGDREKVVQEFQKRFFYKSLKNINHCESWNNVIETVGYPYSAVIPGFYYEIKKTDRFNCNSKHVVIMERAQYCMEYYLQIRFPTYLSLCSSLNIVLRKLLDLFYHGVLLVVKKLYDSGMYHGDVKPENIIFYKEYGWLLCDFDTAGFIDQPNTTGHYKTLGFAAPEHLNCNTNYMDKCDVYSCGEILSQILFMYFDSPLDSDGKTNKDHYLSQHNIFRRFEDQFDPEIHDRLLYHLYYLVDRMTEEEPNVRFSIDKAISFFETYILV